MSRLAVFAYGSLVHPGSAAATLGRAVEPIPAQLEGWTRRWSTARDNHASEKTFARPDGSLPDFCLGLNLEPAPGAGSPAPNGALIELTEAELERLDLREMRYRREEVTEAVRLGSSEPHPFERLVAYRARPEHHRPTPPPGAVVLSSYLATVEAAFAALGPGELEAFHASTGPPPVAVTDAVLVSDRIPPGNPRAW